MINKQNIAENALQKTEDNKKEIINIYSKLKNITTENVKPLIEQNSAEINNIKGSLTENTTRLEELNTTVTQNSTDIAELKNNTGNSGGNSSAQGSANGMQSLCPNYIVTTGGTIYTNGLINGQTIARKVRIYAEKECMAKITFTIRMGYSSALTQISMVTLFMNDVPFEKQHFNVPYNKGSSVSGEFITFTGYCHLKTGINIFRAYYERAENTNISVSYYGLTIQSSAKVDFTNNFMFYNFENNGTQYVFSHGGCYAFAHYFESFENLLNYNHSLEYRDTSFQGSEGHYITPLFLPELNTETGEMEKSTNLYKFDVWQSGTTYVKDYAGTISKFNSLASYKDFVCHGASEFVLNGIGGLCCVVFGDDNKAAIFKYINATLKTKTYTYTDFMNEVYQVDAVKTLDKTPMQQPLFIVYDCNKNGYLLTVDITQTTPTINFDNKVLLSSNTFISHTYFYNNKYYSFYHKNGWVYRRIFTFENNVVNIEEDKFFDYCQDLVVVNNQYVIKVFNSYPFLLEQCFYE